MPSCGYNGSKGFFPIYLVAIGRSRQSHCEEQNPSCRGKGIFCCGDCFRLRPRNDSSQARLLPTHTDITFGHRYESTLVIPLIGGEG